VSFASVTHLSAKGGRDASGRDVLDALGHAIIVTDLNGEITFWNPAAERIYGWTASDVTSSGLGVG